MNKDLFIPLGITFSAILILILWSPSPWITGIFSVFLVVSLLFYFVAYQKRTGPCLKLAQWYFVALAVQCLHFIEEYVGEFYVRLPEILEIPAIGRDEFVIFNLGAYAIFILGGIALFRGYQKAMVIPIFFILFGVLANGIVHVALAIWSQSYFPGLYTALVYLLLGPYLLKLLRLRSKLRADSGG